MMDKGEYIFVMKYREIYGRFTNFNKENMTEKLNVMNKLIKHFYR